MSLSVSSAFITAANADANRPKSKVQLVLGNYASSSAFGATVVSSGDFSTDYPAAGAIDGDRTEINVGPASGADNDVGLSSWKSSGVPDNGDTVTLDITFSTSRTINRIKLYHLSSHGLKTYKLSYWTGSAWTVFAATSDVVIAGQTSITTTGQLDTVDFSDITTTKVRLQVTATAVALDKANVVELEVYRLVDITDRISDVTVNRQRDYKLGNPMATQISIVGINTDRFFSFSHVPTSDETAAGFVNAELTPGIGVLVSMGFTLGTGDELVSSFVGTIDRIQIRSKSRDAVIECRDGMKGLINKIDSSKLKSSQDITTNIQYVLNRANISNYEMHLDTTGIIIDYFFTQSQDQLSTIRDLVQASGDSLFYFDETGTAVFKFFSASTTVQHIYTSQSDWQSGTLDSIDATTTPGQISYLQTLATTWNNSTAGWTQSLSNVSFTHDADGIALTVTSNGLSSGIVSRALTSVIGEWDMQFREGAGNSANTIVRFFFMGDAGASDWYEVRFVPITLSPTLYRMYLYKVLGGVFTLLSNTGSLTRSAGTQHTVKITRDNLGDIAVSLDGTLYLSVTDTSITSSTLFGVGILVGVNGNGDVVHFQDGGPSVPSDNGIGTWTSPSLDMGASIQSLGILSFTQSLSGGTTSYSTATSADNVTYDAFVAVSGNGQINSTVRRYIKVKAIITVTDLDVSPAILDITVTWAIGSGGSPKYPPAPSSATFRFDSTMLDIQQEIADNLGGDTAILNDITVQAQPFVLAGVDADVQFQGTVGTPPSPISASVPLTVTNGDTITIAPVLSSGMDTSRMSGANPPAAAITFAGGATGSWVFSSIHPTLPVLKITITHSGTITNLQIQGKHFSNATYLQAQTSKDATSIATYGDRKLSISNQWIVSTSVASTIAATLIANSKSPTSYIPTIEVRPMWYLQIGDRVTAVDYNTDLSADYIIVGKSDGIQSNMSSGEAHTVMTLVKVPAGS